jgi:hypothetical protein
VGERPKAGCHEFGLARTEKGESAKTVANNIAPSNLVEDPKWVPSDAPSLEMYFVFII